MPKKKKKEEAMVADYMGKVEEASLVEEMKQSYLAYAMSVIVARALPDVRDGLKPVHRRILYAMWSIGLKAKSKFRKSAHVIGEVMAKYHPHGDASIYDAMVRMAQDFSMRYPLVWGQGNFGSMDGDKAAAMRYTEAKMQAVAEEMLYDIDKDTVDFISNYDGSVKEPTVLPAKLPNLLLNGGTGIAVGMATKIPPHNLNEVVDGIIHLIDNPEATVEDLMKFVKGPDFPTGGIIYDIKEIKKAYVHGKGKVVMRGKAEIDEYAKDKFRIIISTIPYQVNKATLIEKMAALVRDKKIVGVRDLRDESDRNGVRMVVELKKDAYPKKVLNKLYKLTQLQDNFYVNMLALVDGLQPQILNLKDILQEYIKHRQIVVRRRTAYELAKAKARAHILEGLKIALDNIDEVIKTIKASKDKDSAKKALMKQFKLSEKQAVAILEMRLQNLANLERQKIEDELKEKRLLIEELEGILASESKILDIIKEEIIELKEKYGDERKTKIVKQPIGKFNPEDLIPNEATIVVITKSGYIKRIDPETFRKQKRGGKGVIGISTKDKDFVVNLFSTDTHNDLLFFTNKGRVFKLKAYEIPSSSRRSKGQALVNFLQLSPGEKVTTVLSMEDLEGWKYLVMVTSKGVIKKVKIDKFEKIRSNGLIAIKLKPQDRLEWVKPSTGEDEVILTTTKGQAIHFKEKDVRSMGRVAAGVRGIKLKSDDSIVHMGVLSNEELSSGVLELLVIMANGYGKRTAIEQYKVQKRGGVGVRTAHVTDKTGDIVSAMILNRETVKDENLVVISAQGQVIRLPFKGIPVLNRDTQGVRVMKLNKDDKVASITLL